MAGERTTNPYATHGPQGDDGPSWAEYFRGRRWDVHSGERVDQSDDEPKRAVNVIQRGGWKLESDHQPGSLVNFVKALARAGFEWRGVYSTTLESGGVFGPDAAKAGEEKPDRLCTSVLVAAVKPGYGYCRLLFEQVNGGSWKCEWRNINGEYRPVSDKELREWINGAAG